MKFIKVLNTVNEKTDNLFYLAIGIVSLLSISAVLHFTGNEVIIEVKEDAPFGIIFLGYFLHTLVMAIIGLMTGVALWFLNLVRTWIMDELAPAFKSAIRENYDVKPQAEKSNKSKIEFS